MQEYFRAGGHRRRSSPLHVLPPGLLLAFLTLTLVLIAARGGHPRHLQQKLEAELRSETLEGLLQQVQAVADRMAREGALPAERWGQVQEGLRRVQATLGPSGGDPKAQPVTLGKGGTVPSRGLVFNSTWGWEALERLRAWRSSLFLRMAQLYTEEERLQTQSGSRLRFWVKRVEPPGYRRYDIANPITSCPFGAVQRVGGSGDGGKFLCVEGLLRTPGCLVYSLGSNGQYEFEEAMLNSTMCQVHTFDCTYDGKSLDNNKRHFYHKVCLGRETATVEGLVYWDYPTVLSKLGHTGKRVALLKVDIEGFEFDLLSGWSERDGCILPLQVAIEIHYQHLYNVMVKTAAGQTVVPVSRKDFSRLFWPEHQVSLGEITAWFGHFANLGYAVVSREDNPWGQDCCSEFTLMKVEQPADCPSFS